MGESEWGEATSAGGGSGPEAGARTAGRAREMPQSPAALRAAAHSEGARRRDRAAKTSCSELKSPLPPSQPPQNLPVPPRARLRNLAPSPTTIVPAHLTAPPPGEGGGGSHPGSPRPGWERVADGSWVEGGSPSTYRPEGWRGRRGGETAGGRI